MSFNAACVDDVCTVFTKLMVAPRSLYFSYLGRCIILRYERSSSVIVTKVIEQATVSHPSLCVSTVFFSFVVFNTHNEKHFLKEIIYSLYNLCCIAIYLISVTRGFNCISTHVVIFLYVWMAGSAIVCYMTLKFVGQY